MKRPLVLWTIVFSVICGTGAVAETTGKGIPVNELCPVMDKKKVNPKITAEYKGKTYAFCCKGCIKDFQKDPEKYIAAMGGSPSVAEGHDHLH